jgi:glycosyltransferase involved in cell wall biosynthesis
MNRLRLLMIAPCADSQDVGEAWSAFQWVDGIARRHDVTVLTYFKRGRRPLSEQMPHARVIEWPELPLVGKWERLNSMLKPSYPTFYRRARKWMKQALGNGEYFDLVHQVVPIAPRYSCPATGLGIPYILGPLAGSLPDPPGFRADLSGAAPYTRLRRLDAWRLRHEPKLRQSMSEASAIIGVAPYMKDVLGDLPNTQFYLEAETGILQLPESQDRPRGHREVRVLSVGRIVRTKGLVYALKALGKVSKSLSWRLDVLGEGEDEPSCRQEVERSGLGGQVHFHGKVDRQEVSRFYREANLLLFPSLKEPSGNVVFEAMSHGLPVLTCAAGGPDFVVNNTCGRRVPVTNPAHLVESLRDSLEDLLSQPHALEQLGKGARNRVRELALWEKKIDRMDAIYRQTIRAALEGNQGGVSD